jgi:hypothetical protein
MPTKPQETIKPCPVCGILLVLDASMRVPWHRRFDREQRPETCPEVGKHWTPAREAMSAKQTSSQTAVRK